MIHSFPFLSLSLETTLKRVSDWIFVFIRIVVSLTTWLMFVEVIEERKWKLLTRRFISIWHWVEQNEQNIDVYKVNVELLHNDLMRTKNQRNVSASDISSFFRASFLFLGLRRVTVSKWLFLCWVNPHPHTYVSSTSISKSRKLRNICRAKRNYLNTNVNLFQSIHMLFLFDS